MEDPVYELDDERFFYLEHLAGLNFRRLDHLHNLKYFQGYCKDDEEGLNEFCQSHLMLEQLHITTTTLDEVKDNNQVFGEGDWKLLALKVLVYYFYDLPFRTGMDHLVKACPNLEELHLTNQSMKPRDRMETIKFFSSIRFQNLTWLRISEIHLFDGSYLSLITKQCPKLERIHLETGFVETSFFSHLVECFQSASNLRDLRLNLMNTGKIESPHVQLLLKALLRCSCSNHFERLVLINETDNENQGASNIVLLQSDFLLSFVSKMAHLVALCLVGFQFDPSQVDVLKKRIAEEVAPKRPAFWFYVGPKLPKGNDTTVPWIHYYEIVNPIDAYYAPPRF